LSDEPEDNVFPFLVPERELDLNTPNGLLQAAIGNDLDDVIVIAIKHGRMSLMVTTSDAGQLNLNIDRAKILLLKNMDRGDEQ
jgi:hypothetical protein